MAHASQKPLEILLVDIVVIPVIYSLESSPNAEIVTGFKGPFNVFGFQMHGNLFID